jgi:hypothetical protein
MADVTHATQNNKDAKKSTQASGNRGHDDSVRKELIIERREDATNERNHYTNFPKRFATSVPP